MKRLNEKQKQTLLRILVVTVMLSIAGACVFVYLRFGKSLIEFIKDTDRFKDWVHSFGAWSAVILVAVRTLQTVVKFIPAEPMEIGAGLVFGWFGGLMLCLLGSMLGSVVILFMTRRLGTRILELFHLDKKLRSMRFLQDREKRNRLLFIFYLIPGTPKDSMTYFVGCTDMNLVEFMILSSVARIPSIVSSTICGAFLGEKNIPLAVGVFAATSVLSIIGGIVYKKISARYMQKKEPDEPAPEGGETTSDPTAQTADASTAKTE